MAGVSPVKGQRPMTEVIAMTSGKDGSSADQSKATYSIKNVSQETLVLATTIVIFILCAIFIRGFFSLANISTLARTVSVLGILGVGMTVVVIGRGLDLSQVAVLAICAAWSLKLIGLGYGLAAGLAMVSRLQSAFSMASPYQSSAFRPCSRHSRRELSFTVSADG
jgi:predicted ABC-type sugar transport system permease subunit